MIEHQKREQEMQSNLACFSDPEFYNRLSVPAANNKRQGQQCPAFESFSVDTRDSCCQLLDFLRKYCK